MPTTRMAALAGLFLATALPAVAQQGGQPRQPAPAGANDGAMMVNMHGPGAPMRGGSPAAMLVRMKGPLNLTDDQVKRLETMATAQRTALEPNAGAMLRARADLADARKGEGDLAATRKALEKLAAIRVDRAMAHLKAMQETRTVLTAEQREKMAGMRGMMRGQMMRHGGMGGMMHGGHGQHGMGMMGPGGGMGGPGGMRGRAPGGPGSMGPVGQHPPEGDDGDDLDAEEMLLDFFDPAF